MSLDAAKMDPKAHAVAWLSLITRDLYLTKLHYRIYLKISERTLDYLQELNATHAFWSSTRAAQFTSAVLGINRMLDTQRDSAGIRSLLNFVSRNLDIFPDAALEIRECRKIVSTTKGIEKRIRIPRDKQIAHSDLDLLESLESQDVPLATPFLPDREPIIKKDVDSVLEMLESVVARLTKVMGRTTLHFDVDRNASGVDILLRDRRYAARISNWVATELEKPDSEYHELAYELMLRN